MASFHNRLVTMIASVVNGHPVRVAVDGIDAAGKTTLANSLVGPLSQLGRQVIRASIDGFLRPKRVRYKRGPDSPEGYYYDSFDYPRVIRQLLEPLGPGGDRVYRTCVFDYIADTEEMGETCTARDNAILLVDGVFLLRPELNPYWDFRIFVDVSFEAAIERAVTRDRLRMGGEVEARRRYEKRYHAGQRVYISECDPASRADVIVRNDDRTEPTIVRASG